MTEDVLATDLDACVLCAVWVATSTGGGDGGSSGGASTTKAPAISDGGTGSEGGGKGGQQWSAASTCLATENTPRLDYYFFVNVLNLWVLSSGRDAREKDKATRQVLLMLIRLGGAEPTGGSLVEKLQSGHKVRFCQGGP